MPKRKRFTASCGHGIVLNTSNRKKQKEKKVASCRHIASIQIKTDLLYTDNAIKAVCIIYGARTYRVNLVTCLIDFQIFIFIFLVFNTISKVHATHLQNALTLCLYIKVKRKKEKVKRLYIYIDLAFHSFIASTTLSLSLSKIRRWDAPQ